jgi:hypothetical protein
MNIWHSQSAFNVDNSYQSFLTNINVQYSNSHSYATRDVTNFAGTTSFKLLEY